MSERVDREIFEEIERDVQRILRERRHFDEKRGEEVIRVHYFRLRGAELPERALDRVEAGEIVLIAFEAPNLDEMREEISEAARKLREKGGKAYFIKYPVMLVVPKRAELEIYR